jgi:transglutaminase-like putative cysteine protease
MRYKVRHLTRYRYDHPISLCHNEAHLLPRGTAGQRVLSARLTVTPTPAVRHERRDFFGNRTLYFSVESAHREMLVSAESQVEVHAIAPPDPAATPPWERIPQLLQSRRSEADLDAAQYLADSPFAARSEDLHDYAEPSFPADRPLLEAVIDLMQRIYAEFSYDPHFTSVATPLDEVLEHKRGVCQDFAHLAIACLRSLSLPARYVSGYLETEPPPGQERLEGADASHAWFAVFVPSLGWVDFDPTNNRIPGEHHITVAWGRDFGDVTPLKGVMVGSGKHTLEVGVDVVREEGEA